MPAWVTVTEAARTLETSIQSVRRLVASGLVTIQYHPEDARITLVDVDELRRLYAIRHRARIQEFHE